MGNTLEHYVDMGTEGNDDGIIEMWYNGLYQESPIWSGNDMPNFDFPFWEVGDSVKFGKYYVGSHVCKNVSRGCNSSI